MKARVLCLPGDGVGPEVMAQAWRVARRIAEIFGHALDAEEMLIGGVAIDQQGEPLPPETLAACKEADAILLGAVGGPAWDDPQARVRPEQGLLALRQALGLFANLRPVRAMAGLAHCSPLRGERTAGVDLLVVRELTSGLYFGKPRYTSTRDGERFAVDTLEYSETEIRRVVSLACDLAMKRRQKLTSVDKANVLETSRLWRHVVTAAAATWPKVEIEHQLVDACAMRLISNAADFDVIVTENMFGDILTDEAAVLVGSLGLLPSGSVGEEGSFLYEPIHGSAPDIAGRNVANPIGAILSVAMMFRWSFGLEREARAIENAVETVVERGAVTHDIGGSLKTDEMTDEVLRDLETQEEGGFAKRPLPLYAGGIS